MSTSLIYHAFGAVGYRYLKAYFTDGAVYLHIARRPKKQRCAVCGSADVIRKGQAIREIRSVPIGEKPLFLVLHLHRLYCTSCSSLRLEPLEIADPKKHWAKALGRYIVNLLHYTTVEDVGRHPGMSWNTVKQIHLQALQKKYSRRKLRHLKYLGVDEIAVRKGHSYLTVVVDLETGAVVWVAPDRTTESLEVFLAQVKRAGARIEAIAMDMWPAYIRAALNHFASKVIVFDRYHMIALCNKMLDEVRRGAVQDASRTEKDVYEGVRYLLLRGEEKIRSDREAREKLDRLFALNQPLHTAYLLKEELRSLRSCSSRAQAEPALDNRLKNACAGGVR